MSNYLSRALHSIFMIIVTLIGLAMTLIFVTSTIIALGLLYLMALLRGKPFSPGQFWRKGQTRAREAATNFSKRFNSGQPVFKKPDESEVTDVKMREIK